MRGVAVPVLESALDRSLQLATSMDARGYGRRVAVGRTSRRLASGATVGGLLLLAAGTYGVIDGGSLFGLGLPVLAVAAVLCGVGLAVGGRRTARRLPPGPLAAAGVDRRWLGARGTRGRFTCRWTPRPGSDDLELSLAFPSIPLLPVVGILIALVPARGTDPRSLQQARRRLRLGPRRAIPAARCRANSAGPSSPICRGSRHHHVSTRRRSPIPRRIARRCSVWNLDVPEGELCVVVGETGTGRVAATSLWLSTAWCPHFSGGTLAGTVTVDGRTTKDNRPRESGRCGRLRRARIPLASFVTETVEDELAYTMENLGVPADAHAPARGGRDRPAGPAGPARPLAAGSFRGSATAGGDRGRPDCVRRGCGPRRTYVRPRSRRGRRGPELHWPAWCTIWGSRW